MRSNRNKNTMPFFVSFLKRLIRPVEHPEKERLGYWREQILNSVLLVAIFIGFAAAAFGIAHCIREGVWVVAAIDIAAYLLVIVLFVSRRIPYVVRAACAAGLFYGIGAVLLFSLGIFGSGLVWLFVFPVAAGIFLGPWPVVGAIFLNFLTLLVYNMLLLSGLLTGQSTLGINEFQRVLVIEGDFILLTLTLNASIIYLVRKFQASLASEKSMRKELEAEVAERKQLEAALRESESRYRTYFESVSDVIFTLDTDLYVTGVSPSAVVITGYTEEEVVGKTFYDLEILDPAYLENAFDDCAKILKGGQTESVYEFVLKDGSRRFGQMHGAPLMRGGEVVGIIAVARDITDLMDAWNALEHSLERFQETVELLPSIVMELDLDMQVTYTNSLGLKTFGLTPGDIENGVNA
ncbi:MAG: PAS domain-containing protein, partial [Thermodesulfobacteriota bacterium]